MQKIIFISFVSLILSVFNNTKAQQFIMNSQYMINAFAINPAAAGTKTYAPLVLDVRRQWTGIREAPVGQHLSYHTSLTEQIGVGGYLYNDVAGPSRRTGLMLAFSSQIKLSTGQYLSLGLGGSMTQYVFDRDKLVTEEAYDPTVANYATNLLVPDLNAGLKLYGENYHLGWSMFNLIQTRSDLFDIMTPVTNNLQRTMYFTGSYIVPLTSNDMFFLEPSAVIRMMFNAPMTFDLNLRLLHESGFWFGASYRYRDAIALMVGFSTNKLGISYSYDINTSALRSYNSGSHEVTLTYKAKNRKGNKSFNGGKYKVINCPSF